ncbi:glycosyl transferase family protein [Sphingomonas sp. DT-51]|uniref:glycosyl transferase family protein n=1 Tax=Sphingomonas sp. DT-51 TaxID=3396165 RepID=UPI003F19DE28
MSGAWLIDRALAEVALFAAATLLLLALDDLLLDAVALLVARRDRRLSDLPPSPPLRFALFVPAWREERVIGAMLRATLARCHHADYRLYVGCYPNDPATRAAVAAQADPRVHLVTGTVPGPTSKADCLNSLWRAMQADPDWRADAVVLHDAEDVVHPEALRVFAALLRDAALVQLPVVPLIDPARRLVSGHYADEFAEAHTRDLTARAALGAALPLAGVGCAIRVAALERLAADSGEPFAADSLTEDYELGLRAAALGLVTRFARVREASGALVATRGYFPDCLTAAVRQKARWVGGIAFAGWDRTGWGRAHAGERWMRWRDRRSPLAALAIVAGYAAMGGTLLSRALHGWCGSMPMPASALLRHLLFTNAVLLAWRIGARARLTAALHGWREGLWAIVRLPVSNLVAVLAAWRALRCHIAALRGAPTRWDKIAHRYPVLP